MKPLLQTLSQLDPAAIQPSIVRTELERCRMVPEDWQHLIPSIDDQKRYQRIRLLETPVEVLLMVWPAGIASAIHSHTNYWGYIKLLEGEGVERPYELKDNQLVPKPTIEVKAGDLLAEEWNGIHQFCNASSTQRMVSLHVYYPAKRSLASTCLFDPDNGKMGILNGNARTASWNEPGTSFEIITHILT